VWEDAGVETRHDIPTKQKGGKTNLAFYFNCCLPSPRVNYKQTKKGGGEERERDERVGVCGMCLAVPYQVSPLGIEVPDRQIGYTIHAPLRMPRAGRTAQASRRYLYGRGEGTT